jgi:hypothetical protein
MSYGKYKICALSLLLLSACSHLPPPLPLPDTCEVATLPGGQMELVCGQAGPIKDPSGYLCFKNEDIELFLERGSK